MGENDSASFKRDWRFWMIFSGLTLSALLSALEGSIVSTALPTISAELDSGENYVWIINIYFLTWYSFFFSHLPSETLSTCPSPPLPPLPTVLLTGLVSNVL